MAAPAWLVAEEAALPAAEVAERAPLAAEEARADASDWMLLVADARASLAEELRLC